MLKRMQFQTRQVPISHRRRREQVIPAVPALPHTVLLLEMETRERCVDLRRFSQLVLSDVGATMQLLRLVGREYGDSAGPERIEDCIADLGIQACFEAMSMQIAMYDARCSRVAKFWAHCKDVAEKSQRLSDEMSDVNPDKAYLAGLLHAIGSLPQVLGWDEAGIEDDSIGSLELADQLALPEFVCEFFSESQQRGLASPWSEIVRASHLWAARLSEDCAHESQMRPSLYKMPEISAGALNPASTILEAVLF